MGQPKAPTIMTLMDVTLLLMESLDILELVLPDTLALLEVTLHSRSTATPTVPATPTSTHPHNNRLSRTQGMPITTTNLLLWTEDIQQTRMDLRLMFTLEPTTEGILITTPTLAACLPLPLRPLSQFMLLPPRPNSRTQPLLHHLTTQGRFPHQARPMQRCMPPMQPMVEVSFHILIPPTLDQYPFRHAPI